MTKRKTNQQYQEQLFSRDLDYINLEPYIDAKTKILHECVNEHQWLVSPDSILNGYGCPYCAGNKQYTTQEYQAQIQFRVVEEYISNHVPILHECIIGHQWKASPANIKSGTGCPTCSKSGFDSSKPATLYFISFWFDNIEYFKIGITNKSIEERFVREKSKLSIKLLWSKQFDMGKDAQNIETILKRQNSRYQIMIPAFQRGNTEIFSVFIDEPD
jgi:hypothetical protein